MYWSVAWKRCSRLDSSTGLHLPPLSILIRCNTKTLPESRGPNFLLPPQVVSALCRVRDAEHGTQQWEFWCNYLDTQEGPQKLPPAFETTTELPPPLASTSDNGKGSYSIERNPGVNDLLKEIEKHLQSSKDGWDSLVFAGEGEPTMRLDELLHMAKSIQDSQRQENKNVALRLNTNGLVQPSLSKSDKSIPQQIFDSGITKVSIALMTADPQQYEQLMDPAVDNAHLRICKFIREATTVDGLEVETTAVEQDCVDKEATEALSDSLHVISPVRWRPYFA